jgi:hypothetical protein
MTLLLVLLLIPVGTRRVAPRVGALVLLALLILVTAAVLVLLRLRHDRIVRFPFRWGDNFCGSDSRSLDPTDSLRTVPTIDRVPTMIDWQSEELLPPVRTANVVTAGTDQSIDRPFTTAIPSRTMAASTGTALPIVARRA